MTATPAFAAIDWGTTSFRLWVIGEDGSVVAERRSGEGLTSLKRDQFADVLEYHLQAAGASPSLPAIVCGMAGSRQGWTEARYLDLPAGLEAVIENAVAAPDTTRNVLILPGLAQRMRQRPDVIRGEETQLIGAAAHFHDDGEDGIYCLPGTHSKWVRIEGGQVTGFSTFMTGELFAVMAKHSILAHTVAGADTNPDLPAFTEAVTAGHDSPEMLTSLLFSVRGGQLLFDEPPETAAARLSGYIVGAELAGSGASGAGAPVRLVASGRLASLYRSAFAAVGIAIAEIDADEAVRAGLAKAARSLGLCDEGRSPA